MKKFGRQAVAFGLFFTQTALAHQVQLNTALPAVSVTQDGELTLSGQTVHYKNWTSNALNGKVRVVHHLAGRKNVKEKNQGLMEAIKAANFDRNKYQTTTIINADDIIMATGLFVKSSAEDGKRENPHSQVILDQKGSVKKAWQLKEKESFIAVLDKTGKVQFVSEGKLSPSQIQQVTGLVKTLINQ